MLFCVLCVTTPIPTYPPPLRLAMLPSLQREKKKGKKGALIKMASWDLEEGGWLWLLPQWQGLEEEMGVVLCKRPHRAYLFSRFFFPSRSPTAWLVWLDESAAKHLFFFLLVIKHFFFCRSTSLPLLHPGTGLSRGIGGKRDRGLCCSW